MKYDPEYYQENKKRINSYNAKWQKENPEKMRLIRERGRRKKGVQSKKDYLVSVRKTREEKRESKSNYRKENRVVFNNMHQQRRLSIIAGLNELIQKIHCVDCNLSFGKYPWLAKFHHEDDRSGAGKGVKTYASSITRLFIELDKGVFLCPNCHDTRHFVEDMTGIVEMS